MSKHMQIQKEEKHIPQCSRGGLGRPKSRAQNAVDHVCMYTGMQVCGMLDFFAHGVLAVACYLARILAFPFPSFPPLSPSGNIFVFMLVTFDLLMIKQTRYF